MPSNFRSPTPGAAPVSRRDLLRIGGLATMGLTLPRLLQARASAGTPKRGRARGCIFIFLQGGPPQLDTFDPKPAAAVEVRGEFKAIATSVPGTLVCEHLPRLARLAGHYALIR